jgi:F-type H+-transporting ATPase subunit gamma
MPSLIDIRRRLRSVRSTQQVTKAMKMVAAAKLRRAQERVFGARPYADAMRVLMRDLMARIETSRPAGQDAPLHPLLARRTERNVLLLVLSGDKGLAGAFNTNIVKAAHAFLTERERRGQQPVLITIGRKGRDFFRRRRPLEAERVNIFARVGYNHARDIAGEIISRFANGQCDAVYLLYNEFKSILTQRLVTEPLLPLEPEAAGKPESGKPESGKPEETAVDYIYEQPPAEIYRHLLPRFVEVQVFRALLESAAAEQAARMTAMDAATNNAAEMIDHITLNMNRIRQAAITKEIIEIVSGAAALGE